MIKKILKPFDLEKAKQGAKLVTDKGYPARIICWDCNSEDYKIIALVLINRNESPIMFMENGVSYMCNNFQSNLQIVEDVEVPDRWRDREDATFEGYYITTNSYISSRPGVYQHNDSNHNVFATEKQAQSALAMAQISQIMANDKRFGGPLTDNDWLNDKKIKYTIRRFRGEITKGMEVYEFAPLAFHTNEQRNLFFEENQDLLKKYFML